MGKESKEATTTFVIPARIGVDTCIVHVQYNTCNTPNTAAIGDRQRPHHAMETR